MPAIYHLRDPRLTTEGEKEFLFKANTPCIEASTPVPMHDQDESGNEPPPSTSYNVSHDVPIEVPYDASHDAHHDDPTQAESYYIDLSSSSRTSAVNYTIAIDGLPPNIQVNGTPAAIHCFPNEVKGESVG